METTPDLVVVLDACVLYPAPLRDYLLYLASQDLFQPKWSTDINEEWIRNLLKNRIDLVRTQLERTVNAMNRAFPKANIDKDISIINILILPDPDDRHVLATAIKRKAEKIITANIKDFPKGYIDQFKIQIQHPDEFISELVDANPESALTAFQEQVNNLKNPPLSVEDVLSSLKKCGLQQTVLKINDLQNK